MVFLIHGTVSTMRVNKVQWINAFDMRLFIKYIFYIICFIPLNFLNFVGTYFQKNYLIFFNSLLHKQQIFLSYWVLFASYLHFLLLPTSALNITASNTVNSDNIEDCNEIKTRDIYSIIIFKSRQWNIFTTVKNFVLNSL